MNIINKILMITLLFSTIQMQECLEFREIQEDQNKFLKEEIKIYKNQFKKDYFEIHFR